MRQAQSSVMRTLPSSRHNGSYFAGVHESRNVIVPCEALAAACTLFLRCGCRKWMWPAWWLPQGQLHADLFCLSLS